MKLAMLLVFITLSFAMTQETLLKEIHNPPGSLPGDMTNMPKLSPLLVDDSGKLITIKEEWEKQRKILKEKWQAFIGEFPDIGDVGTHGREPLQATVLTTAEISDPSHPFGGFVRRYVKYQIEDGVFTDGYLLTPKNVKGKLPAVVVFHQTVATQAKQVAGVDASNPELMMGVQLVKRGYVVLCPRCFIFDESADYTGNVKKMQGRHPTWKGMARMTYDGLRAVDYLESLPYVDKARIGGIGHSLGAKEVLYAAAFDERYKVAVFSEGGIGLTFSNWDAIWYLSSDIKKPDFDLEHHQLIALIAPRAFLLLAGDSADNDKSWAFIESAIPVYKLLGSENNLGWLNHRLGHRYPPKAQAVAEAFIDRQLTPLWYNLSAKGR